MRTLTTCPHCRAIIDDSPFCSICGKSPREEVDEKVREVAPSAWATEIDRGRLMSSAVSVIGIVAVLALIWVWSRPPDETYDPVALPEPTPTTVRERTRTDATSPSVEAPNGVPLLEPLAADAPADSVALSPWEEAPTANPLTGERIVAIDYVVARSHVADLLAAVPEPWSVGPPRGTTGGGGSVDLAEVEASQPFAARSFGHEDHGTIGDLWLTAAPPHDDEGRAYVEAARAVVDGADPVRVISPRPGVLVSQLDVDDVPVWVTALSEPSWVLLVVPDGVDPTLLGAFVDDWQLAALALGLDRS